MASIVIGAVTIGIISACAIPFGYLMSRRKRTRVVISNQEKVSGETERNEETESVASINDQSSRFEIRIFVVNHASNGTADPDVAGFTVVGSSARREYPVSGPTRESSRVEDSRVRNVGGIPINSVRSPSPSESLCPNPAIDDENSTVLGSLHLSVLEAEAGSSVPPEISSRETRSSNESTRLEITISGPKFVDFTEDVRSSSTPTSSRASGCPSCSTRGSSLGSSTSKGERSVGFWNFLPFGWQERAKTVPSKPCIEMADHETRIEEEARLSTIRELTQRSDEESRHENIPVFEEPSKNDANRNLRKRGLAGRIWETFKETTQISSL